MKVIVSPDQSVFDIALQYLGSAEMAFKIAELNGIAVSDELQVGQQLIIPDVVDQRVVKVYKELDLFPASAVDVEVQTGVDYDTIGLDLIVQ
ncbi:MAG: LysM domain-containing protein [Bacteroidota bacterium]